VTSWLVKLGGQEFAFSSKVFMDSCVFLTDEIMGGSKLFQKCRIFSPIFCIF